MATKTAMIMLKGGRVTADFREALFRAATRAGVTPNEFVLLAAAQQLRDSGAAFVGVFCPGDLDLLDGQVVVIPPATHQHQIAA